MCSFSDIEIPSAGGPRAQTPSRRPQSRATARGLAEAAPAAMAFAAEHPASSWSALLPCCPASLQARYAPFPLFALQTSLLCGARAAAISCDAVSTQGTMRRRNLRNPLWVSEGCGWESFLAAGSSTPRACSLSCQHLFLSPFHRARHAGF